MKIIDCAQGTPEWLLARCGIPTASEFDKIVTTKGERSKQRDKYLYQLAGERIIGKPEETYTNGIMQRGQIMEAEARLAYELMTGNEVSQVGFCLADGEHAYGASPDGLVCDDGSLEIKCPTLAVHVSYLLGGVLPSEYFQQVQGQLFVTGRKWVDFMSYYPGIKPLIVRVKADDNFVAAFGIEIKIFCKELGIIEKKLKGEA